MSVPRKLDIFSVLKQADLKNKGYFKSLTEDERKGFYPYVIVRWLSGTFDPSQVFLLNEVVNPATFSLNNHKELFWYLLIACMSGKEHRYAWNKLGSSGDKNRPVSTAVVARYYRYSISEAQDAVKVLGLPGVLDIAEDLGLQPDEISKIQKEFKGTSSAKPAPKGASIDSLMTF